MKSACPPTWGGVAQRASALLRPLPGPVLACLLLLCTLAAQQEPQTPASTLLSRLAARNVSLPTAVEICAELNDRTADVRGQAVEQVRRHYVAAARSFDKAREHMQKAARKHVPACQRNLLGRKGAADVETLRGEALAVTRAPDLDKKRIHDEIDPRRKRLEELLLPTLEQLLTQDVEFAAEVAELRSQLDVLRGWFELYIGGLNALAELPGGLRAQERIRHEPDPPRADSIDRDLDHLCLCALPMSGRDQKALELNLQLHDTIEPEEYLGTFELNRIRYTFGLPLLAIDGKLQLAAKDHSSDMLRLGFFSHTSPVEGKSTPGDRAARFGTSGGAENIAAGQSTGRGAIDAWWYSPGHHKNMLGNHGRTGLGRADNLWTQMFGG